MQRFVLRAAILVLLHSVCLCLAEEQKKDVVCYYTNWAQYRPGDGKYVVEDIDPFLCDHIYFAFAQLQGNSIGPYEANDNQGDFMWRQITNLKNRNPNLKIFLAVGGYSHGSARFSQLVADKESRTKFIRNAIIFLQYWNFDGLDLDWEYPGDSSPMDKENLNLFVKELSEELKRNNLLFAAALPAGIDRTERGFDLFLLSRYMDYINIMTYDYHGLWENVTGAHSPLNCSRGDLLCMQATVDYYVAHGASKCKVNIGIGLYARTWTLRRSGDTTVGSPAIGGGTAGQFTRAPGVLSYYEVCMRLRDGYSSYLDPTAQVKIAYKGDQFISYDDEETLKVKLDWIKANDFAGVMVWALDHDDFTGEYCGQYRRYPLITLIHNSMESAKKTECPSSESTTIASTPATTTTTPTTTTTTPTTTTTTPTTTTTTPTTTTPTTTTTTPTTTTTTPTTTTTTPTTTTTTTTTTTSTTTSSTSTTTRKTSPSSTTGNGDAQPFVCPRSDDTFAIPNNCTHYYVCYRNIAFMNKCPNGMSFNPQSKKCEDRSLYTCP